MARLVAICIAASSFRPDPEPAAFSTLNSEIRVALSGQPGLTAHVSIGNGSSAKVLVEKVGGQWAAIRVLSISIA